MEVFLFNEWICLEHKGLLHARGGVSIVKRFAGFIFLSSPRSWRCFNYRRQFSQRELVFSTLVEVFLGLNICWLWFFRLLHARGGVSPSPVFIRVVGGSSPRSWRCFHEQASQAVMSAVFSTLVEVFPKALCADCDGQCLLHARGGVSSDYRHGVYRQRSSPRSWRCFWHCCFLLRFLIVFSTLVEVFLRLVILP